MGTSKPLTPEILALVPNGIENLVLHCTVCMAGLPVRRRAYGHCAGACHKVVVMHRRYVISLTKCVSCLHPSSPEERAEFKAWRVAKGERQLRGGRRKGVKYLKPDPGAAAEEPNIATAPA